MGRYIARLFGLCWLIVLIIGAVIAEITEAEINWLVPIFCVLCAIGLIVWSNGKDIPFPKDQSQ